MNGIVVAIDPANAKVRVQFPDRDEMISDWLPVGQRKTLGDFDYWLPDLNTQVVCLMDENCEAGVVLCAIYSDEDQPPVSNADLFYKKFQDGTVLQYDRATHKLTADIKGDLELITTGSVTATIGGTLTGEVTGNTTLTTPQCTLNGNLQVNGNIIASGNVADLNCAHNGLSELRQAYDSHSHGGGPAPVPQV